MKKNNIKLNNGLKSSKNSSVFLNIYYFFSLYRYLFLILIGLILSALVLIIAVDYFTPSLLKNIDNKTTLKLFDDLQEAGRHQDAIVLMEFKGGFLNDSPEYFEYKSKLSDSYIKVGDYSKAEKILLDMWNDIPSYLEYEELEGLENLVEFVKSGLGRQIYQLYEKMGDVKNQKKYYKIYRGCYDKVSDSVKDSLFTRVDKHSYSSKWGLEDVKNLVEFDSIVVSYYTNKDKAILEMQGFIKKIYTNNEYGRKYKLRCLNKLIGWEFENDYLTKAYLHICMAVELVKEMKLVSEYEGLGLLSDYCYRIHDVQLSKDLYTRYEKYIEDNYSSTDLEYLSNYARKFRYIEKDDISEIIASLIDYCQGMKNQIKLNMPSMSGEQRERFAKTFDVAYDYSFNLLKEHPCAELANLCFDNVSFRTGLLLRSDMSLKNTIYSMNNQEASNKLKQLETYRRELIYQSVSGKKIFSNSQELKDKIEELEKSLALISTDFKHKNDFVISNYESIQDVLNNDDVIVELIEHDGNLMSLLLQKSGTVKYISLCNIEEIERDLKRPIYQVYHDEVFSNKIYGKLKSYLKESNIVYYVPNGVFNQISLGTLYLGDNKYLCDVADIRLLSNPTELLAQNDFKMDHKDRDISLWGGVDYGGEKFEENLSTNTRTAIKRGDRLVNLRYSSQEVNNIYSMLKSNLFPVNLYTGNSATEKSFKDRNDKKDYILHISTHGFFNDKGMSLNSMLESGLLFAGANKYWTNDTIVVPRGEDDGILRADEISNLNLSQCSLVVLSACETGLGFSQSSEGVYGLQRAFKLAGVNQILMSLWDVDDRATSLLMTEFYSHLLKGESADKALKESKNKVRLQYPSPEYWGSFVLLH